MSLLITPPPLRFAKTAVAPLIFVGVGGVVVISWIFVIHHSGLAVSGVPAYLPYVLLGLLGAIVANTTGVGGGVVFIPAFSALQLSSAESIATSIAIQCFGMTMGALSYQLNRHRNRDCASYVPSAEFWSIVLWIYMPSAMVIVLCRYLELPPVVEVHSLFRVISILIGTVLAMFLLFGQDKDACATLQVGDMAALAFIGAIGGIVTFWISVGIGEFVAVYLLIRRYPAVDVIAIAVTVSALSVLTIVPHHIAEKTINFHLLVFIAFDAMVGGYLSTILNDYSRYIIAWKLCTTMKTSDLRRRWILPYRRQAVIRLTLCTNRDCYRIMDPATSLVSWLNGWGIRKWAMSGVHHITRKHRARSSDGTRP